MFVRRAAETCQRAKLRGAQAFEARLVGISGLPLMPVITLLDEMAARPSRMRPWALFSTSAHVDLVVRGAGKRVSIWHAAALLVVRGWQIVAPRSDDCFKRLSDRLSSLRASLLSGPEAASFLQKARELAVISLDLSATRPGFPSTSLMGRRDRLRDRRIVGELCSLAYRALRRLTAGQDGQVCCDLGLTP